MLNINDLHLQFNPERYALRGVSLHLKQGDFACVIGGNGAGKSTLLNCVSGLYHPTGSILIDGKDVSALREHERAAFIGRVFQDPTTGTAGDMQIEENLALAHRRGKRRALRWQLGRGEREYFRELLVTLGLGLEDRLTTKVGLLSGGQRQALTLLMATMNNPKLLLLDEHTAALDPKTAARVLELTNEAVSRGRLTTLMVTHNMRDAIAWGNRLIMMDEGRIVLDISGEEKHNLSVERLIAMFSEAKSDKVINDRMVL